METNLDVIPSFLIYLCHLEIQTLTNAVPLYDAFIEIIISTVCKLDTKTNEIKFSHLIFCELYLHFA